MKIKTTRKIQEEREVEVGEIGNLILVQLDLKGYRFGKLKGIGKSRMWNSKGKPTIEFKGDSYNLSFNRVMGVDFPSFYPRQEDAYILSRSVRNVFVGLDSIISHLGSVEDSRYKGHADLIRKIAAAQRK